MPNPAQRLSGSPINLTHKTFSSAFENTAEAAFGKRFNDQEFFISLLNNSVDLAAGFNIAEFYPTVEWLHFVSGVWPKLETLYKEVHRILENMINEHKMHKATGNDGEDEDLVDAFLDYNFHGSNEFSLTINNIKAVVLESSC